MPNSDPCDDASAKPGEVENCHAALGLGRDARKHASDRATGVAEERGRQRPGRNGGDERRGGGKRRTRARVC